MLEWIWDNFSAVAGDHPAFESYRKFSSVLFAKKNVLSEGICLCEIAPPPDWSLHQVLLAGWGCPIGELFDLEKLADVCERQQRWSFFVSSEVCNVPGGVARSVFRKLALQFTQIDNTSPPNILAIF